VIELSAPVEHPRYRVERATSKLRAGRFADAIAEVEDLSKSAKLQADELYGLACIYAVASEKVADKKQTYADRAIELLRQAAHAGLKDVVHMKKDPDLNSLRGRNDFNKLIADLEAKSPPKSKDVPPPPKGK